MSLRLVLLLFLLAMVSGCIASKEVNMEKITVSSEAFKEGGAIPAEYTCDGKNVSPPLSWKGIPENAKSIALIMDDPDAPAGIWVHWLLFNIPSNTTKLPKGIPKNPTLGDRSRQGVTSSGRPGYGGPCPPPGKPHRYYFKVYALDTMLDLQSSATKKDVENAMKGHVLAQGELMGRYGR